MRVMTSDGRGAGRWLRALREKLRPRRDSERIDVRLGHRPYERVVHAPAVAMALSAREHAEETA